MGIRVFQTSSNCTTLAQGVTTRGLMDFLSRWTFFQVTHSMSGDENSSSSNDKEIPHLFINFVVARNT